MRLSLTFQRHRGTGVDVAVQVDASATVGQLASYLASAEPRGFDAAEPHEVESQAAGARLTLTLVGKQPHPLDPTMLVAESPLVSGATVALSRHEEAPLAAAARLVVHSGLERGREFALREGSSLLGRDQACEVVLTDPMVSRRHARLNVADTVEIIDQGSANGVEVGGTPVARATLGPDDVVTVGDTSFSISPLRRPEWEAGGVDFVRPARVVPAHEGRTFEAPPPPERRRPQRFPTIALAAPLVMGAVLYAITRSPTSLVFVALSPLMLIGSALEGRIVARREFREAVAAFRADVEALVADVRGELDEEVRARLLEDPSTEECVSALRRRSDLLWSRRRPEPDFGRLRLGIGTLPSRSSVELPRRNGAPYDLVLELQEAVAPLATVAGVPVTADLTAHALGVVGDREQMLRAARALVTQATALHSPAELVVAALLAPETAHDWHWLTWLPHVSSAHSPLGSRHLTAAQAGSTALVAELEALLDRRVAGEEPRVHLLVVVESDALVDHSRLVALAEAGPAHGIGVLWLSPERRLLPAACRVFVETEGPGETGSIGYVDSGEEVSPVTLEALDDRMASVCARALAPVTDVGARGEDATDLPRAISQLALLGPELASRPEAVLERWLENASVVSGPYAPTPLPRRAGTLRAVLGQSAEGPHTLDLRGDGPHALVGGTTGAGKSELLQSWLLSLAVTHSPERVTFLLVDYKGGSAFSDCVDLPHTIGLVTDLSPHLVRRALTSLRAELRHREELLAEHGAKDLVELETHGIAGAPPSLVIVVDEFAALVQDVPDFVNGMIDVAQRGRSLGLHLILATQRPSGVITGNLRANTNLRIALRMADETDSTDVLGTPVAADFDPAVPGRAVSKSGPRRLVPFQTAYAGGWTSDVPEAPDISVEELSLTAPVRWEALQRSAGAKDRDSTDIKRLVRSVRQANDLAALPVPRKAWLPVLPTAVDLTGLPRTRRDDDLTFALGDDPETQAQPAVSFRPDREGNLAVYGTGGSGKSTLLRALAVAAGLSLRQAPCHVYALDFGSRALTVLEELPHVGSVVGGSDHERVTRLLDWLRGVVDERAPRYAAVNAATITDYRRITGQAQEPRILLLVDGVAAFRQAYETTDRHRYLDLLTSIASEGRPVGVHLVLSSDQRAGIHTALASSVQRRIVLRMATEDDYSMLGVPQDVLDSQSPAGRGLDGGLEIQVGVLGEDRDDAGQAARLRELAEELRASGAVPAPPIRRLPDVVTWSDLSPTPGEVVLGLDSASLTPVTVEARACFLVCGPPGSGRSTALRSLVEAAARGLPDAELHYVGNSRSALVGWAGWSSVSLDAEAAAATAKRLAEELPQRPHRGPRLVVVVESAGDFAGGPADLPLQALTKACIAQEQWFVAEGEVSTLRSGMFLTTVKSSRRGLALQPDPETGTAMYSTPFTRLSRAEMPPGRGLLVGGGRTALMQVALPADGA